MSSKIIENNHKKQCPSGQTNSIKSIGSFQVKEKQEDSKMTSLKNSEDNAQNLNYPEQNTACQSNQKICDKKEEQQNCGKYDSGEAEGRHRKITCMKRKRNSDMRSLGEGEGNTPDLDKELDPNNQDNVCPICTKAVGMVVQCGICKNWFDYKCEKVTKEEVELKYPKEQ